MLSGPYNNYVQLFQTRDHVVIFNEMVHDVPHRPAGRASAPAAAVRRWQGDPRGRWDGDTLVVETTNFTDKTNVRVRANSCGWSSASRAPARTRCSTSSRSTIRRRSRSRGARSLPMAKTQDQIYEYACHEGNYAMSGILRGADGRTRSKIRAQQRVERRARRARREPKNSLLCDLRGFCVPSRQPLTGRGRASAAA